MPANKVVINTENGAETVIDLTGDNVAEGKVFKGVIFHGADGNSKTGTFTIDDEISEQDDIISRIKTALQGKASGSGGGTTPTQEKTVDVVENGTVEVIPDVGFVLSKVTANVNVPIPDGYIKPSGELEVTENGTHDVTAYASVNVNVAGSGSGGGITADQIATGAIEGNLSISANNVNPYAFYGNGKITEVSAPNATSLGNYAFYNCGGLTSVYFPNATSVGEYAFQSCGIVEVEFPSLLTIPNGCFRYSGKIKKGTFPNVTSVGENAFRADSSLQQLDFSVCATIYQLAFISCTNLNVIIFRSPTVITLKSSNAFSSTPIASGTGYVYVPSALVDSYKTATNWSTYANQFRAIEDYPEITGG